LDNGSEFFNSEPILILSGPLYKIHLLTFSITNILGFSTLVTTNSARMRVLSGENMKLLELGLRRAQGPNAGCSASKYSFLGSFDGKQY
jgi:nicotinate phosphoribosyltransferase